MTNFVPQPILIRDAELFSVHQVGDALHVTSKSPRVQNSISSITIAEIEANPHHYMRNLLPTLAKAGAVAVARTMIDGKAAQIAITAEQYAMGAAERARYAAWDEATTARVRSERAFWDGVNEGGSGFNPYR